MQSSPVEGRGSRTFWAARRPHVQATPAGDEDMQRVSEHLAQLTTEPWKTTEELWEPRYPVDSSGLLGERVTMTDFCQAELGQSEWPL